MVLTVLCSNVGDEHGLRSRCSGIQTHTAHFVIAFELQFSCGDCRIQSISTEPSPMTCAQPAGECTQMSKSKSTAILSPYNLASMQILDNPQPVDTDLSFCAAQSLREHVARPAHIREQAGTNSLKLRSFEAVMPCSLEASCSSTYTGTC